MRNPNWSKDETILALDIYFKDKSASGSDTHPSVVELSNFLNKLPIHPTETRTETFRNQNGVAMKLGNFQRLDPEYQGKGLSQGADSTELPVWEEFAGNLGKLFQTAQAIRDNYSLVTQAEVQYYMIDEEESAPEGNILTAVHRKRERSAKLIQKKKIHFNAIHGKLFCEACGFNFEVTYGYFGKGFIECHHEVPLSTLQLGSVTKLKDLRLVCSNCHSIIHRSKPWPTVDQLKGILKENEH